MRFSVQVWKAPKQGNTPEEYEDAASPSRSMDIEGETARFAVADGATESAYAKLWARILVKAHALGWLDDLPDGSFLPRLRSLWEGRVSRLDLPWHLEEKVRAGACAAFLGLTVTKSTVNFMTFAVGDCEVAQVREDKLILAFPIEKAADFHSRPRLLSTRAEACPEPGRGANADLAKDLRRLEGRWEPGDEFYLMTDAIACWFLGEREAGRAPWRFLRDLTDADFPGWLEARRREGTMRNDDVTLVRVAVKP